MKRKHIFSISEFAQFARTTRHALVHYEKIGLLQPISRGENNYRYYSYEQLGLLNLIRTLQALGVPLHEIKNKKGKRSPAIMHEFFEQQIEHTDEIISNWIKARKLLEFLKTTVQSVLDIDEDALSIQYMPKQPITLGELNDYSDGKDDYDALASFYRRCGEKYPDMDMNYSVWGMFSEERIKKRDWKLPDRYYFNNPSGNEKKPAAFYAIGYKRGGYGHTTDLYERLLDYINASGFQVCGPAFEEYPLNELFIHDENNYLIRVMITVCKKDDGTGKN